jgi:hypothetical protein
MDKVTSVSRTMLPAFSFTANMVQADTDVVLGKTHDWVVGYATIGAAGDHQFKANISFHALIGTVNKGTLYNIAADEGAWMKGLHGTKIQIVFGDTDPAEGVSHEKAAESLSFKS